jgi:hypothetical protein
LPLLSLCPQAVVAYVKELKVIFLLALLVCSWDPVEIVTLMEEKYPSY